jgi:hypothetical protein
MLKAASPPLQASDKWEEVRREGEGEREREREKSMRDLLNYLLRYTFRFGLDFMMTRSMAPSRRSLRD